MADVYALQQQGVADGTAVPADRADGRQVGAGKTVTVASKPTDTALNIGDRLYLGKRPRGCKLVNIGLVTGTSLATSTVDVGDDTTANKYVDGATLTTTDVLTPIGPKAAEVAATPSDDGEDLWATIGVANIAAAVDLSFVVEFVGVA